MSYLRNCFFMLRFIIGKERVKEIVYIGLFEEISMIYY